MHPCSTTYLTVQLGPGIFLLSEFLTGAQYRSLPEVPSSSKIAPFNVMTRHTPPKTRKKIAIQLGSE